jgi:formylglycine-generating enzyme required for sulfatase activity
MDAIFSLIKPDSWYERPIPERHRLIFYLGHLEAFDWNQICRGTLEKPSFHPEFDQLFEAGIDPKQGELPQDTPSDWPSIEEVKRYNARVRAEVDRALAEAPSPILHVAIEHRWMHVETTGYLLHHLPLTKKNIPDLPPLIQGPSLQPGMIEVPSGTATLGRCQEEGFGWDNEFGKHEVVVPSFSISKYKITNGQYLRFVEDGAPPPPFWERWDNQWVLKTMFEEMALPKDWPVFVSQREAQAYAAWAGKSLPTEEQFHRAAFGMRNGEERIYPWGNQSPNGVHGNFNFVRWDPLPVTALPLGDSDFGVSQLVGNGWEWTSTVFSPFEGFELIPTYPGYSSRFFDQDHYVLKGGGPLTASCLLRRSFRNWFRPGYPHMHAGFRCVEN